ncbi:MAG: hypothetical protein N2255_06090, partial [Kiritimatiellae bacterium]|nr:hypothetical protein [Kiritimatiellia bacterium]
LELMTVLPVVDLAPLGLQRLSHPYHRTNTDHRHRIRTCVYANRTDRPAGVFRTENNVLYDPLEFFEGTVLGLGCCW